MKKLFVLLLLFTSSLFARDILIGIVPQQSPLVLNKKWQPVIEHINNSSRFHLLLQIEKSIPEFEKKLYAGVYDIAYMNPYHYVKANRLQKYEAQLRSDKMIKGILVSNEELNITQENLQNQTILFPAPNAFAATLLIKYELLKFFNIDVKTSLNDIYVNSHDSVYKGVARGIGKFGGGIERTYNSLTDPSSKEKLFILYRTNAYPSHPIAFHTRVKPEELLELRELFESLPSELLTPLAITKLIRTQDSEYDTIRDLEKYF